MSYTLLLFLLGLVFQLIYFVAMYAVLDVPHRAAYFFIATAFTLAGLLYRLSILPSTETLSRVMPVIGMVTVFVLPISLSRGPLVTRIARLCIVNMSTIPIEILGNTLYSSFGGTVPVIYTNVAHGAVPMIMTYCVLIPVSAPILNTIVMFFRRQDKHISITMNLTVLTLLMTSYLCMALLAYRFSIGYDFMFYVAIAVRVMLILAACMLLYIAAQHGFARQRQDADRAAVARQAKHLRGELDAITRRALAMQRLRHDIANQVDVVDELMSLGHYQEADAYLVALQDRADDLMMQNSSAHHKS